MKVRNKKTGKIGELGKAHHSDWKLVVVDAATPWERTELGVYDSLGELCEEWEDYEEPREVWYIDWHGDIRVADGDGDWAEEKSIGNYFETKEEAEKAVEKLKAWKRLKDKGFRFTAGWTIPEEPKTNHIKLAIRGEMDAPDSPYDLNLLFGGEDE